MARSPGSPVCHLTHREGPAGSAGRPFWKASAGLVAVVFVAAVATAGSALAQVYGDPMQREASIRERISDGLNTGDLTYSQAARLRSELRQIQSLDARYQDDGMAGWQMRDLNSRLSLLDSRLNYDISQKRGDEDYGY